MKDYINLTQDEINIEFVYASEKGNLELVKYLLTSDELKNKADLHVYEDDGFLRACANGRLEVIKYFLTSTELKEYRETHATGFNLSCENGHLEIVKYLLTSSEMKEPVDINTENNSAFKNACYNGYLNIVTYLLTSDELKDHVDIHVENDTGFKYACSGGYLEIVKYFIFDMAIEKTEAIIDFLMEKPNEQVEKLFNIRELNNKLDKELSSDNINSPKKNKI
jgi:ankyrin repeat protein